MFYKCRITKCIEVAPTNFQGTHPACSWPLWTLSMCSTYFSCHWAAMSCLKRKCFAKGNIRHQDCLPAWFCQDKFVEDGEDEAVQQDGVEEDHQSGGLVAHDEADERQNHLTIIISNHWVMIKISYYLLKHRQLAILSLLLLLAEVREGVQLSFVTLLISMSKKKSYCAINDDLRLKKILSTKKPKRPNWKWDPACFPQGRRSLPYCCFHHKPGEENYHNLFTNPWILWL